MSESSSSASTTLGPSPSLASPGGKTPSPSVSSPPPSNFVKAQDSSSEDDQKEQPPKKKAKRLRTKKVAVWKDMKEWKAGEQGLGRLPSEILDRIISVDSDLDLRDHLALAAVCRYFRTCYRDVVFQVLFQVRFPHLRSHSTNLHLDESDGYPCRPSSSHAPVRGPLTRSLADGRRIFSSGRSLVGAGGWFGWGVSREEFKANKREYLQARKDIPLICESEWSLLRWIEEGRKDEGRLRLVVKRICRRDLDGVSERERGKAVRLLVKLEASYLDYRRQMVQREILESLGLPPTPDPFAGWVPERMHLKIHPDESDSSAYKPSSTYFFNPWPSEWREVISSIVNQGLVSKAEAKDVFKVSDRELLTLKLRRGPVLNANFYSRAGLEALAWRSHGGKEGHAAHLVKLASIQSKREANLKKKNGLNPAKEGSTSTPSSSLSSKSKHLARLKASRPPRSQTFRSLEGDHDAATSVKDDPPGDDFGWWLDESYHHGGDWRLSAGEESDEEEERGSLDAWFESLRRKN